MISQALKSAIDFANSKGWPHTPNGRRRYLIECFSRLADHDELADIMKEIMEASNEELMVGYKFSFFTPEAMQFLCFMVINAAVAIITWEFICRPLIR